MTFDELLQRWRDTRHPSTSALVESIGLKFDVAVPQLPAKKSDAAKTWLAAVRKEPATHLTARLLQLERFAKQTSPSVLWPLFEACEGLPPDPRLGTLVTRLLVGDVMAGWLSAKLTRRLINCIEVHGDRAHFEVLDKRLPFRAHDEGLASRARRVVDAGLAAEPSGPPLSAAEQKALLAQEWKPAEVKPASDPLEAVYLHPHVRGHRQVLADVLLEQGDPRGEFISLQLARASEKRQRQLIKKHQAQWLGQLGELLDLRNEPPTWVDGFVSVVTVRDVKRNQFILASEAPEWATVTQVRRGLQQLSPVMRALRATGPFPLEAVKQWGRDGFKLPALEAMRFFGEPAAMASVLREAPQPVPAVSASFFEYEPTRELRNGLAELLEVPGLERLHASAYSLDVVPRLLREVTLAWVPATVKVLQFGDEERQLRLVRERGGWAVECFDGDPPHVSAHWKELLFAVKGLTPVRFELHLSGAEGVADADDLQKFFTRLVAPVTLKWNRAVETWPGL
ncbi:MAG: hypothetical protein U0228_07525 [Myxococcaceae bacterium]